MPSASVRRCRPLLGTFVEITAEGPADRTSRAVERAFAAIARVQRRMSAHDPASDIGRLNRARCGEPVRVHADTWRVLARAQRLAAATDGAFDVTVGGDLARWGYLPRGRGRARGTAGFRALELRPGNVACRRRRVVVDLGGIAKGFAVDQAVRALRAAGAIAGCVNAGGDLRVFGPRPWPVAVRLPGTPGLAAPVVAIRDGALATSGGYLRRRRVGGTIVTPLLDGRSRRRALAPYASVSVLARTCLSADALTKVVLADPARAASVLTRHSAEAAFIDRAGNIRFVGRGDNF
jgi:thiamine biosynthesis lipoprotein